MNKKNTQDWLNKRDCRSKKKNREIFQKNKNNNKSSDYDYYNYDFYIKTKLNKRTLNFLIQNSLRTLKYRKSYRIPKVQVLQSQIKSPLTNICLKTIGYVTNFDGKKANIFKKRFLYTRWRFTCCASPLLWDLVYLQFDGTTKNF